MIPGGAEWIIIGGVVLVLFGASAIPRFARSIGRAKKEFEKGQHDGAREEVEGGEPDDSGKPADGEKSRDT
jgi:sec-independent protein translocase protein TatA